MDKTDEEKFAEALGALLVALAGRDRPKLRGAVERAAYLSCAIGPRIGYRLLGEVYAAEMLWGGREERRAAGLPIEAHAHALVAVETLLENALADLHRRGDVEGFAAASFEEVGDASFEGLCRYKDHCGRHGVEVLHLRADHCRKPACADPAKRKGRIVELLLRDQPAKGEVVG